ncbi:hypothetical protein [Streptomyces eurocidicus]|uniref:Uncharacterized protein n=1 Tax=Streptomyces eurocidicus TaxID=66423 RepID=A0A7W8BHP8_STREU|nr:hypothetical protein [Streptomyces eurocidicus]MBB5123117.1 hypothetical protein [Streptomyces eurocidicus]MBF6055462.1 hypothetical protein [Streptomyces eurocidicus]
MSEPVRGCVLLLDGTPDRSRGAVPNPTAHALAGADPRRFLATPSVDVVQLPGISGPQSVLAYLQHAAAGPGPLLVWVTGRLMVPSRRAKELHLGLSGSTPGSVRYTGLPWAWLTRTLRAHPGPLVVLADIEADTAAWPEVAAAASGGQLADGVPLFGVVTPAPATPFREAGPYTSAFLDVLRAGDPGGGPVLDVAAVHRQALDLAAPGERTLTLQYGPVGPLLANPAAAPAPVTAPAPMPVSTPVPLAVPAREPAPAPARVPEQPVRDREPARDPGRVRAPEPARDAEPVHGPDSVRATEPVRATGSVRASGPPRTANPVPAAPAPAAAVPARDDLLPGILAAARAGRHNEAAAMAAAWEQQALRTYGPDSPEAGLWTEVRADLARLAGDHGRAAGLWMSAARARLARGGPADGEALAAVKRAHYCWQHSGGQAPGLATDLLALWEQVPGGRDAAEDVRTRLRALREAPPAAAR